MNNGILNGYWSGYQIINTQYVSSAELFAYAEQANNTWDNGSGHFAAPAGATHALITAAAKGGMGGGSSGGGGAAACYRISFPLDFYRHVPFAMAYSPLGGVNIGAYFSGSDLSNEPIYQGMQMIVLYNGGTNTGGGVVYGYRTDTTIPTTIVLSGGASGSVSGAVRPEGAGADGTVVMLPDGGVLASGGGGGSYSGSLKGGVGGSVSGPWGTMYGGSGVTGGSFQGGGGASLFAPGVGSGSYQSCNLPGVHVVDYRAPNMPGGGCLSGWTYAGPAFIYCEFIAPIGSI